MGSSLGRQRSSGAESEHRTLRSQTIWCFPVDNDGRREFHEVPANRKDARTYQNLQCHFVRPAASGKVPGNTERRKGRWNSACEWFLDRKSVVRERVWISVG